jgi:hypothetical protein
MVAMQRIKVLLVGGPVDDHVIEVAALPDKVKVARGNGYEHFAYSGESRELDGSDVPVFTWHGRTKIAE